MASPALALDALRPPPSARQLMEYGFRLGASEEDPQWERAWGHQEGLRELTGVSALMEHWKPLFIAGRMPGDELRERLRGTWEDGSYERDFLEAALSSADELDHGTLVRQELKNVAAEMRSQDDPGAFYVVLKAALEDLKRVKPENTRAFVVHPETLELAQWTVHNLVRFLQAHWALHGTHRKLLELQSRRRAALRRISGTMAGGATLAEHHDDCD